MKILLDECITKRFKKYLNEFEVFTIVELNIKGIKNGKLMTYCVDNKFDILLTIDKNMIHQQNLDKYAVTVVVLNVSNSRLEELELHLSNFKQQINNFKKHQAYIIEK